MSRDLVSLVCVLFVLTGAAAFTIMVDINTMNATEAVQARLLQCDGIWFTNANSPAGINWSQVVDDISPSRFSVSEDVHCCGPPVCGSQQCYPPATDYAHALKAGCELFGSFVYDEPKCTLNNTELDDLLPSYNNRIIVHSRAWFPPHDQDLIDVIDHPGVVGVAFEANPDRLFADYFKIPRGVAIIQALNHDVFVLAPPWNNCSNYTASVKFMMEQLAEDPGVIMNSPRLHIGPPPRSLARAHCGVKLCLLRGAA